MNDVVAVTGVGVVSPFNPDGDPERFWTALCAGEAAVGAVRSFDASPYPCRVAAEVRRDLLAGNPDDGEPATQMARLAFARALTQAGLPPFPCPAGRGSVIVGTVLGGMTVGERYLRAKHAGGSGRSSEMAYYPLRGIAATLAREAGLTGSVHTVSTACASGTDAVGLAYRAIASGSADLVVAGGVDAVCELSFSGFCALKVLTPDRVRPFSRNRTGLALGEGAAFLVLEAGRAAARRGAAALGRIDGYASRSDAVHLTAPHREGRGLAAAATAALRDGGCRPEEIDYVSGHGTGTLYNDWMETKAIKATLGDHAYQVPISSIKGALGHPFGAAGALEAIVCLMAIRDGIVPPTVNLVEPDPECDLDFVPMTARRVRVRTALSLSAGFGGQNAALVIRGPV
jgi:3-oxoacyl-(acyl-carrier-protein) synthase